MLRYVTLFIDKDKLSRMSSDEEQIIKNVRERTMLLDRPPRANPFPTLVNLDKCNRKNSIDLLEQN